MRRLPDRAVITMLQASKSAMAILVATAAVLLFAPPVQANESCGTTGANVLSLACSRPLVCPGATTCCDGTTLGTGLLSISVDGIGLVGGTAECVNGAGAVVATVSCSGINHCAQSTTINGPIVAHINCYTSGILALYSVLNCGEA